MWLELWVGSGGMEVRQAATLLMLGLLGQDREVDFILNAVGSHRKAVLLYIKLN